MPQTTSTAPTRIDPRRVISHRRSLHFADIEAVLAEAQRLRDLVDGGNTVRADLAGPDVRLVHLANLPLGQMLGHLGLTLGLSVHGSEYRFPWPMRMLMGLMRNKFLNGGLGQPVDAPARLNQDLQPDPAIDADTGLRILRENVAAFEAAQALKPNLMLGEISREEWVALTCRHAEWHLSFIIER
ncbi:DUF1569 domain-containing protein [bacterium]|nr:DUF1569 domain-containing protein [bacterium]